MSVHEVVNVIKCEFKTMKTAQTAQHFELTSQSASFSFLDQTARKCENVITVSDPRLIASKKLLPTFFGQKTAVVDQDFPKNARK